MFVLIVTHIVVVAIIVMILVTMDDAFVVIVDVIVVTMFVMSLCLSLALSLSRFQSSVWLWPLTLRISSFLPLLQRLESLPLSLLLISLLGVMLCVRVMVHLMEDVFNCYYVIENKLCLFFWGSANKRNKNRAHMGAAKPTRSKNEKCWWENMVQNADKRD